MNDQKLEEALKTIRESGAHRPFVDPPPPAKWKAWLAPGTILAIVVILLSYFSSYVGRQRADAEQMAERKEMARQIVDLQKQLDYNRTIYASKETEADHFKTLKEMLIEIRTEIRQR